MSSKEVLPDFLVNSSLKYSMDKSTHKIHKPPAWQISQTAPFNVLTFKALRICFFYILQWEAVISSQIRPLTGPKEGGTRVTIEGENLGLQVREITHVRVAGVRCNPAASEYISAERWVMLPVLLVNLNWFWTVFLCRSDFCVCSWPAGSCVTWRNLWCRVPLVVRWSCVSATAAQSIGPSRLKHTLLWYVLYFLLRKETLF